MSSRKVLSVNYRMSVWFENGLPRYTARDLSPQEVQTCVRVWMREVQDYLDEFMGEPDNAFRADVRARVALAEEWLEATESRDTALKTQGAMAAIVDRFMAKDPNRLMQEGRHPGSAMIRPPVSPEDARKYYEQLAAVVLELKDIDL
jgi:hypothetical protein